MARLIIGHTTDKSSRIWVRGDRANPVAFMQLRGADLDRPYKIELEERFGFTGVIEVGTLQPATDYEVQVSFGRSTQEPPASRVDYGHMRGRFRTFPTLNQPDKFCFLLGSCNLHWPGAGQDSESTFRTLLNVADATSPAFMIHCGDQIYYDVPNFIREPNLDDYRNEYIAAWGESRTARKFLTQLPHYMMLDDHELVNDFTNDDVGARKKLRTRSGVYVNDFKNLGIRAYREFQHIHNPDSYGNQALYYNFSYGGTQFFALDTRTERYASGPMIDPLQMSAFKRWLSTHSKAMKFVVTSVPFVGHVRKSDDKWCAEAYRLQREEIIEHIFKTDVGGVTFLTGDMHNSYHATLLLRAGDREVVVHELMSSPLNQMQKTSFGEYVPDQEYESLNGRFSYRSQIPKGEFFNDHSNAMLVQVNGRKVSYEVFRTSTGKRRELTGAYKA